MKKTLLLVLAVATLALSTGLNAEPPVPVCPPVCKPGQPNDTL